MGPCEVSCPDRIMRFLSPVEDIPNPGYAAEWRQRVAEAKARRAKTGSTIGKLAVDDRVKLTHPACFRSCNIETDRFTVSSFRKRTPIFVADDHPGLVCRLRTAMLAGAEITRP